MIRFSFPRLFNFSSPGLLSAYFRHKNFLILLLRASFHGAHRVSDSPPGVWEKFGLGRARFPLLNSLRGDPDQLGQLGLVQLKFFARLSNDPGEIHAFIIQAILVSCLQEMLD